MIALSTLLTLIHVSPLRLQIHTARAKSGLAARLIQCMQSPGGCSMVVTEHLLPQDGWTMLYSIKNSQQRKAAYAATVVTLDRAHAEEVTCSENASTSGRAAHGDLRGPNVMVRQQCGSWQVKFIDSEWAGIANKGCYPYNMVESPVFHAEARAGQLLQQHHDRLSLDCTAFPGVPDASQP